MIGSVLLFLKNHVNERLSALPDGLQGEPQGDRVVFVDGDKMEPITFKLGAVSALLLNVEEDRTLRAPDRYLRVADDGSRQKVQPDIPMNLYVLFVARFKQYHLAWSYLSEIIQHFQTHRVLDQATAPDLPDSVDKLTLELVTLQLGEQNEVWSALRTAHHPSILYKVRMVVFRDQAPLSSHDLADRRIRTAMQ